MTGSPVWKLLGALQAADPGRPRLTWYDDEPGATAGERIELSARVLLNWVSKAGNLLQDELAVEPGSRILLDLPAHWRGVYWALATWSVGAELVLPGPLPHTASTTDRPRELGDPGVAGDEADEGGIDDHGQVDAVVTGNAHRAAAATQAGLDTVLVTLPALGRSHPEAALAPRAIDEARELSTHGDLLVPLADPAADDVALTSRAGTTAYGDLITVHDDWGPSPRVALGGEPAHVLSGVLSAYAADGSVVLTRGARDDSERLRAEGVSLDLR